MKNKPNDAVDYQSKIDRILFEPSVAEETDEQYALAVTIILRTKDRPLCLPRAINSVLKQKFTQWHIVLVNDGGDVALLNATLAPFMDTLKQRITIINNPVSLGMSRGLNLAIDACESEFIIVHDDDDSWEPDFLQETVAFLKNPANADCGGVITHSNRVMENIVNDQMVEILRNDFNSKENTFTRLDLFRLLMQNTFPPISFLFRRLVVKKIGYFNEDLPVLNDWDFNIRCAFHYEIGVIPLHLANYHHRINQQNTNYGNSIIATSNLCLQYETVIRNASLRKMLHSKNHSDLLGLCLALGGQELPNLHLAEKVQENKQALGQIIPWIDQQLRRPLAVDVGNMHKEFTEMQFKLDEILKRLNQTVPG